MSLSLAYSIAQSGLSVAGTATSVVARNVQGIADPNASRRSAEIATRDGGGVYVASITTAIDHALLDRVLDSGSDFSRLRALTAGLDELQAVSGDTESAGSPAALIGELRSALRIAAQSPQDETLARVAIERARDVAVGLNRAAGVAAAVRDGADRDLARSVAELRDLLGEFQSVNSAIVAGTLAGGADLTDQIDRRNSLMRNIAELIGVRASLRDNNDMVLFASNGATLFETIARDVAFAASAPLAPGSAGGAVSIDGVPFAASDAERLGGRIGGLLQLRDDVGLTAQTQFDEIARGLIEAFAETDGAATPTLLAGLFTYAGGPTLPASGLAVPGMAAQIMINANVDPLSGGDPMRLRDGGISAPGNPAYVSNTSALAGYSARIIELADSLATSRSFDTSALLGADADLISFVSAAAGWIAEARRDASSASQDSEVINQRTLSAWQNSVGISLDDELTKLVALERSYQASSRMLTIVNEMYDVLLGATS